MSTPKTNMMLKRPVILDRSINKTKNDTVSLASFSFLFSEILQYTQKSASNIEILEKRLAEYGYKVGIRYLELIVFRDRNLKRETRVLQILLFINTTLWKTLFGKAADSLEKGTDSDDEYMISENEPLLTKFISVPKELSSLNCGAFIAGIVEAVLDGSGFPAKVTAHSTGNATQLNRTTILIKFDKSGMDNCFWLIHSNGA
ncbi:NO signaling/Golgi transport ligand-binding domain-containing protein [Globomyces pollinis-pini]|nr:NO signaling/Golgi transport ligand-binding domain-containing protein [Globomyces pollinis-pini]